MPKIIEIDKDKFERLCEIMCTKIEIAHIFDCSEDTIERWCKKTYEGKTFSEVHEQHRNLGLVSIRRSQMELAKKNPAMAIFLGKNYLGQSDNTKVEHTGGVNINMDIPIPDEIKESLVKNGNTKSE